jgi:hypothetical protein
LIASKEFGNVCIPSPYALQLNALTGGGYPLLGNLLLLLGFLFFSRSDVFGNNSKRLPKPTGLGWGSKPLSGSKQNWVKEPVLARVKGLRKFCQRVLIDLICFKQAWILN